jgi:hypothetical protein
MRFMSAALLVAVLVFARETAAATAAFGSSATLVPPVPVSDRVTVELRVSVRSLRTTDDQAVVTLRLEGAPAEATQTQEIELPGLSQRSVSFRVPTEGLVGDRTLTAEVQVGDHPTQSHTRPLTVVDVESRSVPLLQVGWIEPGAYSRGGYPNDRVPEESDVRVAIDAYARIGVKAFIIAYPEGVYGGRGAYYPSRLFPGFEPGADFDVVGTILNQASKNGQHVFMGLGRGTDLWLTWTGFDDEDRNREAFAHSVKVATELWTLYGHEPSFYGWYLSHEANEIERASKSYYNPVARFLRTFEADKPVLISPSGTPVVSPEALRSCEADVIAYQDAVGTGYVPGKYTYEPRRRIEKLDEVFRSYASAHEGARQHIWANLEVWQMDGPEYRDAYPAALDRVLSQIDLERAHVDVLTAYALPGFLEPDESTVRLGGERALQLFSGYRDYFLRSTTRSK